MTKTQVNVAMPNGWRKQLERLARIYSVEEDKDLTFHDLIRDAIQDKYNLKDDEQEKAEVQVGCAL